MGKRLGIFKDRKVMNTGPVLTAPFKATPDTTPADVCALCVYRNRAWCKDAIFDDRLICPVAKAKMNGGGEP